MSSSGGFKAGDVISTNWPFAHVTFDLSKNRFCDHCLDENSTLKICSSCHKMYYCNRDCQKADWKIHKRECPKYSMICGTWSATERMIFRLLLTLRHFPNKRKQMYDVPGFRNKRCFDDIEPNPTRKGFLDDINMFGNFRNLMTHFDNRGIENNSEELHHLHVLVMLFSHTIFSYDHSVRVGLGLYVVESQFRHSCSPNAAKVFEGSKISVRALRNIKPNEKITVSYISLLGSTRVRRQKLKARFYFNCNCPKCSKLIGENNGIGYDTINQKIAEMLSCMYKTKNYRRALTLGEEIVRKLRRIIDPLKFYPLLTIQMSRVCKLLLWMNNGKLNDKQKQFVAETKAALVVTHGQDHKLYRKFTASFQS